MSDPFIGEIMLFGGTFAPRGWAFCDGQLLAISSNTALFSLLGTTYGGDGRTTFGLPDLRGRAPLHAGHGPGLTNRVIGSRGGSERVALSASQVASHSHAPFASTDEATSSGPIEPSPPGGVLADTNAALYATAAPDTAMNADAVGDTGGGQPHDNMMPYAVVSYCIALVGVFPSRN